MRRPNLSFKFFEKKNSKGVDFLKLVGVVNSLDFSFFQFIDLLEEVSQLTVGTVVVHAHPLGQQSGVEILQFAPPAQLMQLHQHLSGRGELHLGHFAPAYIVLQNLRKKFTILSFARKRRLILPA